jgi:hypothetical protein
MQEVEETDELLLWDDEMAGMDPEDLPRRRLLDFSLYNAEVSQRPLPRRCLAPVRPPRPAALGRCLARSNVMQSC